MNNKELPDPDKNGIIKILPIAYIDNNKGLFKKFNINPTLYDFLQENIIRPNVHKANSKRHYEILKYVFERLKNMNILDIACGTGIIIKYLDPSNSYTGLDIAYSLLKKASKRIKSSRLKSIKLIQETAENLPFSNNSFNFVLCNTALHMIPNYKKATQEISRVLKRGGILYGCCPVVGIHKQFDINWKKVIRKRKMIHSLHEEDIKNACKISDLKYRRIETNGGLIYFRAEK